MPSPRSPLSFLVTLRERLASRGLLEAAVLLSLLALVSSAWIFVEIADEVREGELQHYDELVLRSLRSPDDPTQPRGPAWLLPVARDVTALGGSTLITLITLGTVGFLTLRRKWHTSLLVLTSIAGGGLVNAALKTVFSRNRPSVVPHLVDVTSLSFPSGHSMLSAITYLTLGALLARTTADRRIKVYLLGLAATLVLLIGLTRLYLGVHFPTDVLAGWCAGIVWALFCALIARWLQRRGAVEKETPAQPAGQ
ncbi:phosphatase PAP2 family protein [Brevifollis gellanilyticus]|uniref:Phosphatase PAP2 family protein n=1 Tax=Brevifollis gellanilyticus TaxID=748831 RepID=A0A512MBA7_9BACT|nr:phosphatase PAP2 family protein [Brevifollis gellanilyticus]GEP43621.1 phosphatase PAP2 family protein [Brevifollis gellanilyticus]